MKKLKKSSLDELAKKMPVVNERESAECVGGDYYFNTDDHYTFLGKTLSGNNIYFTNRNDYNSYAQSNPDYLASISTSPHQYNGGQYSFQRIAEQLVPSITPGLPSGYFLVSTGVLIGDSPSMNYDIRSAYNGEDMFINYSDNYKTFDNTDRLMLAYYYARVDGYFPGQELRI